MEIRFYWLLRLKAYHQGKRWIWSSKQKKGWLVSQATPVNSSQVESLWIVDGWVV